MFYDQKKSGAIIKRLRKDQGYTQESFADELNIDRSGIGKIETGDRGCSVDLLLAISALLDVSVDYLFRGNDFVSERKRIENKRELQDAIRKLQQLEEKI